MQKAFSASLFSIAAIACFSSMAHADIYTCRHTDGSTEITDQPCSRSAQTLSVLKSARPAPVLVDSAPGTKSVQNTENSARSSPQNNGSGNKVALAARVEPNVQRNRDDIRRRVLSNELEIEEKSFTDAQKSFNGGNVQPLADESASSPKYLERRARLQQTVSIHERNIAAIRSEISNLR